MSGPLVSVIVTDPAGKGADRLLSTLNAHPQAADCEVLVADGRHQPVADAAGRILLFVDSAAIPEPDLVVRHVEHHADAGVGAVVGSVAVARPTPEELGRPVRWRQAAVSWGRSIDAAEEQNDFGLWLDAGIPSFSVEK